MFIVRSLRLASVFKPVILLFAQLYYYYHRLLSQRFFLSVALFSNVTLFNKCGLHENFENADSLKTVIPNIRGSWE